MAGSVDGMTLRELLLRRRAELGTDGKPLSQRETAARSGGKVSHATIGNLSNGRHVGDIEDETVDGLALALDVPRSRILAAIGRSYAAELVPFEAPKSWSRLTASQRRILYTVGDGLLVSFEEGRDSVTRGAARAAEEPQRLRAARRGKPANE